MPVWSHVQDRSSEEQDKELYSNVAELYHDFRPRYPDEMLQQATSELPDHSHILEIGCGPATATLPLLQKGFHLVCIEPSSGMIRKAKTVCLDYNDRVDFYQVTLSEFLQQHSHEEKYDAILAATSFHWAMDRDGTLIRKLHDVLQPNGKLILMWNLPPEPDQVTREAVALALSKPLPFYFGGYSPMEHEDHIREQFLQPVPETGLFTEFSRHVYTQETTVQVKDYMQFVQTMSWCIQMNKPEKESLIRVATESMIASCGPTVFTQATSILNVSTKIE